MVKNNDISIFYYIISYKLYLCQVFECVSIYSFVFAKYDFFEK